MGGPGGSAEVWHGATAVRVGGRRERCRGEADILLSVFNGTMFFVSNGTFPLEDGKGDGGRRGPSPLQSGGEGNGAGGGEALAVDTWFRAFCIILLISVAHLIATTAQWYTSVPHAQRGRR